MKIHEGVEVTLSTREMSGQLHALAVLPPSKEPPPRRLGGTQNRSKLCVEEKNLTLKRNRTHAVQPVARHYTD
jgi:hypothetical protein